MDEKLLSLPWQIQVALGAGYLAYLVAYSGIRDHHKGIDVPFRAIAFGLVATLLLYATISWRAEYSIRSEEHTAELQSLLRNSYAGFCLKTKHKQTHRLLI